MTIVDRREVRMRRWREVPPEIHEHITATQASQVLGCSSAHIRRIIIDGKLDACKEGGNWRIKWKDLSRFLQKREEQQ